MKRLFSKTILVLVSFAAILTAGPASVANAAEKGKTPALTQEQAGAIIDQLLDDIRHSKERGLILIQMDTGIIPVPRSAVITDFTRRLLDPDEDRKKVTEELQRLMAAQQSLQERAEEIITRLRGGSYDQMLATLRTVSDILGADSITPSDMLSLSITEAGVEPAEVEPRKSVRLRAVYWAKRIASTDAKIQEKVTITGPGTPPVISSNERSLTEFQHGDGVAGTMDGACRPELEIVATTPGKYTCLIEISAPGVQAVTQTVSFTVKGPGTAGATTITPGTGKAVWRRGEAQLDPGVNFDRPFNYEGVDCGFDRVNLAAASYSAAQRRTDTTDGKIYRDITWNIQFGAPPSELRAGQVIELSASGTAGGTPWDDFFNWRGGDWKISEGKWELVHTTAVAPGLPLCFGIGKYAATIEIRQAEARFRLAVPDNPSDKFSVYFSMPNVGSAVYTYEKKGDVAGPAVGDAGQGNAGGGVVMPQPPVVRNVAGNGDAAATDPVGGLSARLQSDSITLRAGEVSVPCGIYVSGWRGNTADRVEVVIDTRDLFGGLVANPGIVVMPGSTSETTGNMDRKEYYFSELWRAERNAAANTTTVPIVVRQRGAGQVRLTLKVNVLPRPLPGTTTTSGSTQTGGRTTRGNGNDDAGGGRIAPPGEEEQGGTMRGEDRPIDPNTPGRTERVTGDVSGRTGPSLENARATQRVFALESAWLGGLGGYPDAGSNSTDQQDHLRWAADRSDEQITQGLIDKFLAQFDRQATKGQENAHQFYAAASARLAQYGADLGDPGSNLKDPESHLRWAQGQSMAKLREAIEEKLRVLLKGEQHEPIRR